MTRTQAIKDIIKENEGYNHIIEGDILSLYLPECKLVMKQISISTYMLKPRFKQMVTREVLGGLK